MQVEQMLELISVLKRAEEALTVDEASLRGKELDLVFAKQARNKQEVVSTQKAMETEAFDLLKNEPSRKQFIDNFLLNDFDFVKQVNAVNTLLSEVNTATNTVAFSKISVNNSRRLLDLYMK